MTMKEYLEKQIRHFAAAKQEAKVNDPMYNIFEGRIRAYTDILLTCSDDILRKKVIDEVW